MDLRKYEGLLDMIDELKILSGDMPIIVEGKRDESSLRDIGIRGEIFKAQTSVSLIEFCDSISERYLEVVLFTDMDKAGEKIEKTVKKYLTDKGVKVNVKIGKKIMRILDTMEAESVSKRLSKVRSRFQHP